MLSEASAELHLHAITSQPAPQLQQVANLPSPVLDREGNLTHPTWAPDGTCVLLGLGLVHAHSSADEEALEDLPTYKEVSLGTKLANLTSHALAMPGCLMHIAVSCSVFASLQLMRPA